jgi:multiple sugar transport system substrate-binding protein
MISQGPSICVFNKEDSGEVLASWLFAQYLLTTDLQIAFSQTEGYIPVTKTARNSDKYKDYLSRSGEDNELYYDVKIAASKMLIDNIDNNFITPVFNGSTSLRNAAGQLIEEVVKNVIRKKKINDEFIDDLYERVTAQYRLNEIEAFDGKRNLGEMPVGSKILIGSLLFVWVSIGAIFVYGIVKNKKNKS